MLACENLDVYYGDLQALWGVSLHVEEGEIVALIGPNGAGKTTIMRTLSGVLKPKAGTITFQGVPMHPDPPHRVVERGVSLVPEGRKLFGTMTVLENLEMGAFTRKARAARAETLEWVYKTFPILEKRKKQAAGTLSGGEQQMVAISRALMSQPKVLLLDEPSLGLAPLVVEMIFDVVREINRRGKTVVLVEQNARAALELADRAYIVESGRIVGHGAGKNLLSQEEIQNAYLGGVSSGGDERR